MKWICALIVSLIASLFLLQACNTAKGQLETSFTPADRFNLESLDGTISFGLNGTYSSAKLTNNTWVFENLSLNGSQPLNTLKVSTQNSSIIINSYQAFGTATLRATSLRYVAQGQGQQTFNIGIAASEWRWGVHPEWSVIVERDSYPIWLGEGEDWTMKPDGTITVTEVVGNVSISYFNFMRIIESSSDLPFYEQHSVSIAIIALATVTVTIGVIIRLKTKESSTELNGDKIDSVSLRKRR